MLITEAAINDPVTPCVIDRPGAYVLAGSIDWTPRDPVARAITIASDDVTIELGGHRLRQVGTPSGPCANVGIWAEGRRGVAVRNGTVRGIHGVGVALKDCHDVELRGLAAHDCGGAGAIDTSFLRRNGGLFVMGTRHGDVTESATGIRIIDCVCSGNASDLDRVVTMGALLLFCENVLVRGSAFHRTWNSSREPSGVQFNVVGLDIVQCANVLVGDCQAHDNRSGGEPAGFFAWGENIVFERCHAHRNSTATGSRACGFNISATESLLLDACGASGNANGNPDAPTDGMTDFSAAGFRIGRDVRGAVLRDCTASATRSAGTTAPAGGFILNAADDVLLTNCVAIGTRNEHGLAAGFMLEPSGCVIEGCRSMGPGRDVWRRESATAEPAGSSGAAVAGLDGEAVEDA